MKKIVPPFLFLLMILLTACPYQSTAPLGSSDNAEKYDKLLVGEWSCKNDDGTFIELVFSAESKKTLHTYLTNIDKSKAKSKPEYFKTWATNIGNNLLFNAQSKDSLYTFFKVELAGNDKFYLTYVNEKFVKENFPQHENPDTENIHQFIEKNLSNESLFSNRFMFVRIGSSLHKLQQSKKGF